MAILTSQKLINAHATILTVIAYYFLTDPAIVLDQNVIFMLGEAMGLPHLPSSYYSYASGTSALIALLLILQSIADFNTSSLPDDQAHTYWRSAVPARVFVFFVVTGGSYLGAEGAREMLKGAPRRRGGSAAAAGAGMEGWRKASCNSLMFTWGFLELVFWFWMFVMLREEGKVIAGKKAMERRKKEEEDEEREREKGR